MLFDPLILTFSRREKGLLFLDLTALPAEESIEVPKFDVQKV